MRALLSTEVGGTDSLSIEEVPAPTAGPGQVVVDVEAVGVNYPDVLIIQDLYQIKPERPFAPGSELAGVVSELGEGVTGLEVGDRVVAVPGFGAMVERVAVGAGACIPVPSDMPTDVAASMVMTYGTSYHALVDRAHAAEGESLLVLGASGGVGLAAVQIGAALGLRVIAACSSQEKVDLCLANGAVEGIVYPHGPLDRSAQKELSNQIKAAGGGGVDIVYDAIGGDFAEPAVRAMNWEGRFLVVGFVAGIPKLPLNLTLLKGCNILGVFWGAFTVAFPERNAENLAALFSMYEAGTIQPHISARFPLDRAAEAISELEDRKATGKVIVTI
ncbi:MAG: NADPH:quinone oxidoreductase family protein [Microthrixaceae bacterium]